MSFDLSNVSSVKKDNSSVERDSEKAPKPGLFKGIMNKKIKHSSPPSSSSKKSIFDPLEKGKKKEEQKRNKEEGQIPPSEKELSVQVTSIIAPDSFSSSLQVASPSPSSLLTSTSPPVEELIDTLTEVISLESDKGIATITAKIQMKDPLSIFQNGEIILTHYDTAPHSFQIQFSGSFEGAQHFNLHQDTVLQLLQMRFPSFEIYFQPAVVNNSLFGTEMREREKNSLKKQKQKKVDKLER
ncbi:MAG: hypothetical protein HYZ47_01850 [Simkania negevensis]|nr:hypothetical protein [Simkania negevensis]